MIATCTRQIRNSTGLSDFSSSRPPGGAAPPLALMRSRSAFFVAAFTAMNSVSTAAGTIQGVPTRTG